MTANNDDDKSGYGKPPKHTRFKKGQSGNPRGRKKGTRSMKEDLTAELSSKITIHEGDQKIKITRQRAIIKSAVARAIKGDRHALDQVLTLFARVIGMEGADGPSAAEMNDFDKDLIKSFYENNFMEKSNE